jgi:DNA-binding MarR family transcriptional regulator
LPSPFPQSDFEALASFRHALSRFLHFSASAARSVGLSPQQHQALLAIKGNPERPYLTVSELAQRLQLRHHSTVGLVDRLVAKKLVARETDKADRRVVHVSIAPKGEALIARLSAAHREELRKIGPELRDRLDTILGKDQA